MVKIPAEVQDLLSDQKKAFAYLATLMKDGSPQVTPLWFDANGDEILINSAKGRVKDRNMRKDHRVALVIQDPQDPYRYIQIRGQVTEITEDGADAHINALSHKYRGKDYSFTPGQVRVIYRIQPESVDIHE